MLYEVNSVWDWSDNYCLHMYGVERRQFYDLEKIRRLNTTAAAALRFIYTGSTQFLEPRAAEAML